MDSCDGFTVRSYPAFGAVRTYRVLVGPDTLYFIRMKGLISPGETGSGISIERGDAAFAALYRWMLIRWFGRKTFEAELAEVERGDPEEMVRSSKKHFKLAIADLIASNLDPPSLFRGQGHFLALWKITARDRKMNCQIEDAASLRAALEHLPRVLGSRLTVKVDPPHGGDRERSRIMG